MLKNKVRPLFDLKAPLISIIKEDKKKEEERITNYIYKVLHNPRSHISLYNGKMPTLAAALSQVAPRKLFDEPVSKTIPLQLSNFNDHYPIIDITTPIRYYDPCGKPQGYTYDIIPYKEEEESENLTLLMLPNVSGFVNLDTFNELLTIYERNQHYYVNMCNKYEYNTWRHHITYLEQWFINIIEPYCENYQYWYLRESSKYSGSSFYCHVVLAEHLLPLDFTLLMYYHRQIQQQS